MRRQHHVVVCTSGRRLRVGVPTAETVTPIVDSVAELREMTDPPTITMEVVGEDDAPDPTREEVLDGIRFLEEQRLIPEGLAAALRAEITRPPKR